MQEHFLKEIEIINYKCFKNFKAKDFKRINLISGRNNVGKTAFMESMIININSKDIKTMSSYLGIVDILRNRVELVQEKKVSEKLIELYKNNLNNAKFDVKSNLHHSKFIVNENNGIKEYSFTINNNSFSININEFSYEINIIKNVYFIDNFGFSNNELKSKYEAIQQNDKENVLNHYINNFDSSIEGFKIIGEKPQCKTTDGIYRDINEFGDGLKHYIGIICSLYACENGQLFIDEIDNGIHYTQLEKLWEIIFTISKEVNCQVFATTHSKEMINAYAKVSQKLEEEDISFIELGKNRDNEVKANVYDKEMFLYELNQNHEVRGW